MLFAAGRLQLEPHVDSVCSICSVQKDMSKAIKAKEGHGRVSQACQGKPRDNYRDRPDEASRGGRIIRDANPSGPHKGTYKGTSRRGQNGRALMPFRGKA